MKTGIRYFGVLAVALSAISVHAQKPNEIKVNVPFSFTVASQVLPAGEYRISLHRSDQVLTIAGEKMTPITVLAAQGEQGQDERNFVRFHRYGDQWFLETFDLAGENEAAVLATLRKGREVKAARKADAERRALESSIALHSTSNEKEN